MNRREALVVGAGLAVGVVGLVMAFVPGVAPDVRVFSVTVAVVGLVAFGLTVHLLRLAFGRDRPSLDLPTPERRSHAIPGDDLDRRIDSLSATPTRRGDDLPEAHDALRRRLKRAAIGVLSRENTEAEARESLTTGAWTDDPRAAAFFSDPLTAGTSMRERLRSLRTGDPVVRNRARHAAAALARRHARGTGGSPDTDSNGTEEGLGGVAPLPSSEGPVAAGTTNGVALPWRDTTDRPTGRWQGVSALALAAGAAGMVVGRPGVLLGSVVGVGFAAYARMATPPTVGLAVERTVSDPRPDPGDAVEVGVSVRNEDGSLLPDCTILDGVPPGLVVTEGSPRHGAALRPGTATRFSYTLEASRGEHAFEPVTVVARDLSASAERLTRVDAAGATRVTCVPRLVPLDALWLRARAERFGGRVTTDATGNGVAFHAVREYQPTDPRSRIDWNRLAKTGELSTLVFREERRATVVVVIDAREEARRAPDIDAPSAVDRSVEAAGRVVATLVDGATNVGVAGLTGGPESCWLPPDTGTTHRRRARDLLATHPGLAGIRRPDPDDENRPFERLRRRLPADAQTVVLSPLCDDGIAAAVRRLDALGHAPTVVSPDPTALDSAGQRVAHVERALRVAGLRSAGIPVADWRDEPLSVAFERLRARGGSSRTDEHARRPASR